MLSGLRLFFVGAIVVAVSLASGTEVRAEALPTWVQNHRPATLWSGPNADAVAFGTVPTWSGFHVLAAQDERFFVQYLGNGVDRDPGLAWIDHEDVGPTGRPILWVAAQDPAPLWSGPDETAVLFGFARVESLMVRLEPAANGRAQVFVPGAGPDDASGLAWTELSSLRPSLAPPGDSPLWHAWGMWEAEVAAEARRIEAEARRLAEEALRAVAEPLRQLPTALLGTQAWPPISPADQERFIDEVGEVARRLQPEVGLPPSLVVAIAINETGWGRSTLSKEAYNYFGIKAHRGAGTAGFVEYETWEVVDGEDVIIRSAFRAYHSLEESVRDLGAFLRSNDRYEPVWAEADDPEATARALAEAGYATDPTWAEKLTRLISEFNLRQWDGA